MKTPTPKLRDKLQAIIYYHTLNVCSKEEVADLSEEEAKKIYKGTIEAILSSLREVVLGKKKDDVYNKRTDFDNGRIYGWNDALQDIANLFR